jgi:hypothetical protein
VLSCEGRRDVGQALRSLTLARTVPWVLESAGALPVPLQRWRKRGMSMVPRGAIAQSAGPGRSVPKNAACPCGSGRKAGRCHPSGVRVN